MGFRGILLALRGIGDTYFRELFGDDSESELAEREVSTGDRSMQPQFISVYDLVSYRVHDHWDLIVDFLGFQFDELAFSFSESDCANPGLMAHLRALRAEFVQGRTYDEGLAEYLELAEELMHKKEMPQNLVDLALGRYDTAEKRLHRRKLSDEFAREAFGLSEEALVAMVFSPFTDRGARLAAFLDRCHPDRADATDRIHAVLGADGAADDEITAWLQDVSGLGLTHLRTLYTSSLVDFAAPGTIISRVRAGDPHKYHVATLDPASGAPATELISGR